MQIVTIAGNVGRDAELRTTQGGEKLLAFSVAVSNGRDKNGDYRPSTWWDCTVWGKRAQALEHYIMKGTRIVVTGRPSVRVHDGKAYLQCSVSDLTLLGGGEQRSDTGASSDAPASLDDEIPF